MVETMTKLYEPMKAKLSDVDFLEIIDDDLSWGAGEKFDGYRELLYLEDEYNEMYSSLGNSHIAKCPQFQVKVPMLIGTVVDCEGLSPTRYLEDNASCFKADAPNAIAWQKQYGLANLVAFDILQFKGEDVTQLSFKQRIPILKRVVMTLKHYGMPVSQECLVYQNKLDYYNQIVARKQNEGHEGVILKDMFAPYQPGKRSNAWLKVKRLEQREYYISGFMNGAGKYEGMVGSVIYAEKALGALVDIGTASGMDDEVRIDMTVRPEFYVGKRARFECQELTVRGCMRHPRYKGLVERER